MFFLISFGTLALTLFLVAMDSLWRLYVNPDASPNPWASLELDDESDSVVAADDDIPETPPASPAPDAHLIWKRIRMTPMDHNAELHREPQPVQPKPDEFLIYDIWGHELDDGTEATDTFLLSDLKMGESVLAGRTTSGKWACGVVTGYKEGQYFSFDGPNEGSLLWDSLLLLRGPMAEAALAAYKERYEPTEDGSSPRGYPLKRTDSGTNYFLTGYPDVAFWERSGCPLYWRVDAGLYHGYCDPAESHPERVRVLREALAEESYSTPLEKKAIEQQAERHRADYWAWVTTTCCGKPERERTLLERLNAAWELRAERGV